MSDWPGVPGWQTTVCYPKAYVSTESAPEVGVIISRADSKWESTLSLKTRSAMEAHSHLCSLRVQGYNVQKADFVWLRTIMELQQEDVHPT